MHVRSPGNSTRTRRPSVTRRDRYRSPSPSPSPNRSNASSTAANTSPQPTSPPPATSARTLAAPSGAHPTFNPHPTTITKPSAPVRACASTPASLRSANITSLGHFKPNSSIRPPTRPSIPSTTATPTRCIKVVGAVVGDAEAKIVTSRFEPGGASHCRSRRPRPAVWCPATKAVRGGI